VAPILFLVHSADADEKARSELALYDDSLSESRKIHPRKDREEYNRL
jgi:hypothetical protein